ncbi:hypothetical protein JW916_03815 [Candidatus Sumerlaeota bacterium]|nr:hypothetical protein [Candidatus Sumerlaeota bacterium]
MSAYAKNTLVLGMILGVVVCLGFGCGLAAAEEEDSADKPEAQASEAKTPPAVTGVDDVVKVEKGTVKKSSTAWYTAYNIWFETPDKMYCINYKTGAIVPAGTEVRDVAVTRGSKGILKGKPILRFVTAKDGREFLVQIYPKFHPGKTLEDYKGMMFSHKDFEELTEGMTEAEVQAIKSGMLVNGMSKRAVLVCYGPPPEHATFSQDSNQWAYWTNRFRRIEVRFDDNGKTMMLSGGY